MAGDSGGAEEDGDDSVEVDPESGELLEDVVEEEPDLAHMRGGDPAASHAPGVGPTEVKPACFMQLFIGSHQRGDMV